MNGWLVGEQAWRLGGLAMLHFLWIGTLVAAGGAAVRLACRQSSPAVKYGASLATLGLLAATAAGIVVWLAMHADGLPTATAFALQPRALPGGNAAPGLALNVATDSTPGQSPGLNEASQPRASASQPQPRALPGGNVGPAIASHVHTASIPGQSPGLSAAFAMGVLYLPYLWLIGSPLTFALLATGLVGTRRLRQSAVPLTSGPAFDVCQRLREALGVARLVTVAACDGLVQPVLVGIVKPCILLPAAALAGWSADELEMVLLHELAHVGRWDNLVNLGQRIVESTLFFHPAVWLVSRQVRRDREECCDAVVVGRTEQAAAYAELLVSVAEQRKRARGPWGQAPRLASALTTASAMADHPLTARIRRILKIEEEPMLVSRGTVGAAGLAMAAVVAAAVLLPLDRGKADDTSPPSKGGARGGTAEEETTKDAKVARAEIAKSPRDGKKNEDPRYIITYPLSDVDRVDLREWLKVMSAAKGVESHWYEKNNSMILSAPRAVHEQVAELLEKSRAGAPGDEHSELVAALKDIETYQSRVEAIQHELTEIRVQKELALQTSPGAAALDKAIQAELAHDPMIGNYKQQLNAIEAEIQKESADGKNEPKLRRLQNERERQQAMMDVYRTQQEKMLREKLKHTLPDPKQAIMTKVKVRTEAAEKRLEEYQNKLAVAMTRARELSSHENVPSSQSGPTLSPQKIKRIEVPKIFPVGTPADEVKKFTDEMKSGTPTIYFRADGGTQVELTTPVILHYDGKTFDEWRDFWRSELKVEKRIEAIEALAAFARAGREREASQAILDIAVEYPLGDGFRDDTPEGQLIVHVCDKLTGRPESITGHATPHVSPEVWLPELKDRLKADPLKYHLLGLLLCTRLDDPSPADKEQLREIARFADPEVKGAAERAITWIPRTWERGILSLDVDDDGKVTQTEWLDLRPQGLVDLMFRPGYSLPADINSPRLRAELWVLLKIADANGDDALTRQELSAKVPEIEKAIAGWERAKSTTGK